MSVAEMNSIDSTIGFNENNLDFIKQSRREEGGVYKKYRFFYTVGLFKFLLEDDIKVENLHEHTINAMPYAPEWCSGVISVRGVIMPVVNMHAFLKTGIDASPKKNKLIILDHRNHSPIALMIDRLPEVMFKDDYVIEKSPDKSPSWLANIMKNKTVTVYEVDHSELLKKLRYTQI
ncbi:MAG: Unknown protein [uncultured Thiotrichaceae bacterium]|uniref:CheW-like domain-containing protein n=1 Tax=uncultured Thiotrichaceae bacterium TaxID=298394 RepID=A0A6S6RWT1_9GAMM|nr:MAG: Unknown protein [uncultured Thiotrichaceae bacterium]